MTRPTPVTRQEVPAARTPEGWPATVVAMLFYAVAAGGAAEALGTQAAWIAAAGAAAPAVLCARLWVPRTALAWFWVVALGVLLATWLGRALMLGYGLGPADAAALAKASDMVGFAGGSFALALLLRAYAMRFGAARLFEVALLVSVVVLRLAPHRKGLITRPYSLTDPLIVRGADPSWVFYGAGALACAAAWVLLIRERRLRRWLLHLGVAALIAWLGLELSQVVVQQAGAQVDALGLQGKGREQGGKRPQEGSRQQQDEEAARNKQLDFDNDFSDPSRQMPVAVVNFHTDYPSTEGVYYFRQDAFSRFDGRRLVAAKSTDFDRDLITVFPTARVSPPEPPPASPYTAEVRSSMGLLVDHLRPPALLSPQRLEVLTNANPARFRRTYAVVSRALSSSPEDFMGAATGDPSWGEATWKHYLEGPEEPRYRALAERIVAELLDEGFRDDPVAQALAIRAWLSQKGTYSLKSNHAEAADPTGHFLFGDLVGYCVHFSHAAVFMLRSLGIPARVGTGYASDEAARNGGSTLLLYGRDAHAWAEVYFQGLGWVPFDVFPQQVRDGRPAPPDPELQRLLGNMLRNEKPGDPLTTPLPDLNMLQGRIRAALALAFQAAALLLLLALFLGKLRLWLLPYLPGAASARRAYRAAVDRLAEVGVVRHYGESREHFAARVSLGAFSQLTRQVLSRRFAAGQAPEAGVGFTHFARAHRSAFSRRQRFLGRFKLWTWLQRH